jgi:hypothetical protein
VNESPASPLASQESVPVRPFNPVVEGMKKGAMIALSLALIYAFAVPLFFAAMDQQLPGAPPNNLQDGSAVTHSIANTYGAALMAGGMAFLIGGIPAFIFGVIGGGIIGAIFRYGVKRRLSLTQVLLYGFLMSVSIVGIRILLLVQSEGADLLASELTDPFFWVMVAGPMILASLGFWWVAYQVNQKMPPA